MTSNSVLFLLCLGIQRPKNLFPEDPCSLGCSGHVRRGLKDQGSLQGERHPPRSGCPSGVALAPAPLAAAHHAPPAGLLHLPIRQAKDRLLPHQRQGHILPALHQEQNCERDLMMVDICLIRHKRILKRLLPTGVLYPGTLPILQRGSEGQGEDGN